MVRNWRWPPVFSPLASQSSRSSWAWLQDNSGSMPLLMLIHTPSPKAQIRENFSPSPQATGNIQVKWSGKKEEEENNLVCFVSPQVSFLEGSGECCLLATTDTFPLVFAWGTQPSHASPFSQRKNCSRHLDRGIWDSWLLRPQSWGSKSCVRLPLWTRWVVFSCALTSRDPDCGEAMGTL